MDQLRIQLENLPALPFVVYKKNVKGDDVQQTNSSITLTHTEADLILFIDQN